jgi:hypothetical protein
MKRDSRQLPLFLRPPLPSPPFVLEPSPDEIRICTQCGKQIITRRRTTEDKLVKEFVDSEGRCSQCAHPE